MLAMLAKIFGGSAAIVATERYLTKTLEAPSSMGIEIPYLYGGVILVNVVGAGFLMMSLGMKVGAARKTYNVQYPKMYAEGDSADAISFNNVQRGHQNALESLPQFIAYSLIGGLSCPVSVTLAGLTWLVGRANWAKAYAEKGAEGRYSGKMAMFIWYSLLFVKTATVTTAMKLLCSDIFGHK